MSMRQIMTTKVSMLHAIFILMATIFNLLLPTHVVEAATILRKAHTTVSPSGGLEYIRPVKKPVVMLEGEALEERQNDWKQETRERAVLATKYMTVSAYNSVPGQTDGSPFHTAIGSMTRAGVVACNDLPIGTEVRFPDVEALKDMTFRVEDRLNVRYTGTNTMDLLTNYAIASSLSGEEIKIDDPDRMQKNIKAARQFGRRYLKIEIVKWGQGRGVE